MANEEKKAKKVALLYPGKEKDVYGHFKEDNASCDMIFLPGVSGKSESKPEESQKNDEPKMDWQECRDWQGQIVAHINKWMLPTLING